MTKLTTAQRKRLKKSTFAVPSKKTKKNPAGRGGYPIPDKSHARNALARVSQHGTPAEKAAVRDKVEARFPDIAVGGKKKGKKRGKSK